MIEANKKFMVELTECQKDYLQSLLPNKYCIRLKESLLIDEKRSRTPKKLDEIYDLDFFKNKQHSRPEKENSAKDLSKSGQNISEEKKKNKSEQKQVKSIQKEIEQKPKVQINENTKTLKKNIPEMKEGLKILLIQSQKSHEINKESDSSAPKTKAAQKKEIKKQKMGETIKIEAGFKQLKKNEKGGKKQSVAPEIRQSKESKQVANNQSKVSGTVEKVTKNKESIQSPQKKEPQTENNINPFISTNNSISEYEKQCFLKFLDKMKSLKASWPFRLPVDPIAQGVPDYLTVVKQPMDLRSIEKKLLADKYSNLQDFKGDINKIFLNSYKFNPKDSNYFPLTKEFEDYYHQLLKQCEKDHHFLFIQNKKKASAPKIDQDEVDFVEEDKMSQNEEIVVPKKKKLPTIATKKNSLKENMFTLKDKIEMSTKISSLSSEKLEDILFLIYESEAKKVDESETKFSINLEELTEETLKSLDSYLKKESHRQKSIKQKIEIF